MNFLTSSCRLRNERRNNKKSPRVWGYPRKLVASLTHTRWLCNDSISTVKHRSSITNLMLVPYHQQLLFHRPIFLIWSDYMSHSLEETAYSALNCTLVNTIRKITSTLLFQKQRILRYIKELSKRTTLLKNKFWMHMLAWIDMLTKDEKFETSSRGKIM